MAEDLNVEVVAADRKVWSGEASIVIARTPEGEIGIMSGHEPVLGLLVAGPVTVRSTGGEAVVVAVSGGFLSVSENTIAILAEQAELADEIDVAAAQAELAELGEDGDGASRWAQARLDVAASR
ncbi:F0F1 ATP synthase subunit epsilon [Jiangella alkaliphila]|uniref:ATP synthase epsilon chain n=1 Tax=Jiangella alkaliphila TaxID=419479 RepID=A0A1H2JKP4_9ACTN|nr:F0F1 ATP synthase subunit epsilon [Jiangella alkaliphila]SDU57020.1 F-type H+-transporting ATPase subunit epsilon [Jiangella alkaliphila]